MGSMQLNPIEASPLSVASGTNKRSNNILNVVFRHLLDHGLALFGNLHRTIAQDKRIRLKSWTASRANMPKLRDNFASSSMDLINYALPCGQSLVSIESRYPRVAVGCWMINVGPFRDD